MEQYPPESTPNGNESVSIHLLFNIYLHIMNILEYTTRNNCGK